MTVRILQGHCLDVLATMSPESVHCIWTSVPYWGLRAYGTRPQIWGGDPNCQHEQWGDTLRQSGGSGIQGKNSERWGRQNVKSQEKVRERGVFCQECDAWRGEHGLEPSLWMWLENEVLIWRALHRVLRKDGIAWLNIGDAYANDGKWGGETGGKQAHLDEENRKRVGREKRYTGLKPKDRMLMPARLAIALQDDGWWIRDEVIWLKPNPMPSSVDDRTTPAHEMLFMLSKRHRYFYDRHAIAEEASANTHARLAQPNIMSQKGGAKQDAYEQAGLNVTSGSRRPNEIVQSLSRRRRPAGWDTLEGGHSTIRHAQERMGGGNKSHKFATEYDENDAQNRPKAGLLAYSERMSAAAGVCPKTQPAGSGVKDNESFVAAISGHVLLSRNKRSVWSIPTEPFPEAHFATAPTKLVEPCIMAGTSERGCCPDCAAPWQRITAVSYINPGNRSTNGPRSIERKHLEHGTAGYETRLEREVSTLGWYPTCKCHPAPALPPYPKRKDYRDDETAYQQACADVDAARGVVCDGLAGMPTIRATVLDPFLGSGTTAVVADYLQRDCIGIELQPKFAEMAHHRISGQAPLLAEVHRHAHESETNTRSIGDGDAGALQQVEDRGERCAEAS